MKVTISHLSTHLGLCAGWVETNNGKVHKVGHIPRDGWFCTCARGKRCTQIKHVQALVPVKAIEAGGRAATAPAGWFPVESTHPEVT